MNTGGAMPQVSEFRSLIVGPTTLAQRLAFNFGFATDEQPVAGSFLDSFTVTVQATNQSFTAIYLTSDAHGTSLAPVTPETIFIAPDSISSRAIAYPSLQPVFANQHAFEVTAPIPVEFANSQVNVYFDLFDNLNAQASQAWFIDLRVIQVPEPSTSGLLLAGAVLGLAACRFRK